MQRILSIFVLLLSLATSASASFAQEAGQETDTAKTNTSPSILSLSTPKHEIRATWLTTLYGLDWPKTQATGPENMQRQQEELCRMLDQLQEAGINLIFFQTRIRNDVAYRSRIEPMSAVFTGRTGKDPGYDPLAYTIQECHKRGIECHAWVVAIPAGTQAQQRALGKAALSRKEPKMTIRHDGAFYLDPGHPGTADYLCRIVREITENYDIDGIQFDYLRYPEQATRFPDQATYRRYAHGESKPAWRRNNLNRIMQQLYRTIKDCKPWVQVSSCPVGKYSDLPRYRAGGFTAFHAVHQEAQHWLAQGWQDLICPMMYYRDNYFYPFLLDWKENACGRPVVPGLGIYFLDPREGNWKLQDITDQLAFCRAIGTGMAFYRAKFLTDNIQNLQEKFIRQFSAYPALLPPATWIDPIPPQKPTGLIVEPAGTQTRLYWDTPETDTEQAPLTYNIYASDTWPVDTRKAENLIAIRIQKTHYQYNHLSRLSGKIYFAITAYDRSHNESEALQMETPYHTAEIQAKIESYFSKKSRQNIRKSRTDTSRKRSRF